MKLIPKYQNEGLVTRQDNTYVAKANKENLYSNSILR